MHASREVGDLLIHHFGRDHDLDLAAGQQLSRPLYFCNQFGSSSHLPFVIAAGDSPQQPQQLDTFD